METRLALHPFVKCGLHEGDKNVGPRVGSGEDGDPGGELRRRVKGAEDADDPRVRGGLEDTEEREEEGSEGGSGGAGGGEGTYPMKNRKT